MELAPAQRWAVTGLLLLLAAGALVAGYRQYLAEKEPAPPDALTARGTPVAWAGGSGRATSQGADQPVVADGWDQGAGLPGAGGREQGAAAGEEAFGGSERPAATGILVHVAGAVSEPGVHRLPRGARVAAAVAAARPLAGAVPDALNLAAPLADGEKVYVPAAADLAPGAEMPPGARGADHAAGGPRPQGSSGGPRPKVNLNEAGVEDLVAVPGLGQTLAERIVAHRRAVKRFRRLEDLLQVPGIGEAKLEQIRPYLTL